MDLHSVTKALLAMSGEIEQQKVLENLIRIVLESGWADRALLIHAGEGKDSIEAEGIAKGQMIDLKTAPVEADYSRAILDYTKRTLDSYVIHDTTVNSRTAQDPYFDNNPPKSILSAPILQHGKLEGVLYLENHLTPAVFTLERVQVVQMLTARQSRRSKRLGNQS